MTLAVHCITKEASLAVLTIVALRIDFYFAKYGYILSLYLSVIDTLQALSSVWVAVALLRLDPVLRTITALAIAGGHLGMPEIVVVADVALVPGVSVLAVTHRL